MEECLRATPNKLFKLEFSIFTSKNFPISTFFPPLHPLEEAPFCLYPFFLSTWHLPCWTYCPQAPNTSSHIYIYIYIYRLPPNFHLLVLRSALIEHMNKFSEWPVLDLESEIIWCNASV